MKRTLALPRISLAPFALGLRSWADLLTALSNLAWARSKLGSVAPSALLQRQAALVPTPAVDQAELIKRVAIAISRAASRVPWRSDCLVQALAAERWLAKKGVATVLCIGARKDEQSQFHAHAWLKAGDTIVTGGDIGAYAPLVGTGEKPSSRD